jgi:bifunctional DNase/RNase
MLELVIESIRVSLMNYQRVVILKEKAGDRYLPIWIGPAEADAISLKLQGVSVPRPLTHDLLLSLVDTLGASFESIIISDIVSDTFYGKVVLNISSQLTEIDCRPSDALALAVRANSPIFVDETVLDRAGLLLDEETGKPLSQDTAEGQDISEEQLRRMSAFTDFIDNLDMDDFEKRK